MRILAAGCTGTIGQPLVKKLASQQHQVSVLGRDVKHIQQCFAGAVDAIQWEDLNKISASDFDAIINLSGANIAGKRWSTSYKKQLIDSRIETTKLLCLWANRSNKPLRFLNASAAASAYPGAPANGNVDESFNPDYSQVNFSQSLVKQWEACLETLHENISTAILRFGVVLSKDGGALQEIIKSSKFNTYAIIGNGQQPFGWVDVRDTVNAIVFLLEHPELTGPFNITSPQAVNQALFAKTFAEAAGKSIRLPLPGFMVKLLFGDMAEELLLQGLDTKPQRLLDAGFVFKHEKLWESLDGLLRKTSE